MKLLLKQRLKLYMPDKSISVRYSLNETSTKTKIETLEELSSKQYGAPSLNETSTKTKIET